MELHKALNQHRDLLVKGARVSLTVANWRSNFWRGDYSQESVGFVLGFNRMDGRSLRRWLRPEECNSMVERR